MSDKMSQEAIDALLGGSPDNAPDSGGEGFTDIAIDVMGEVMNISMGSAATAMSTMLRMQVNITTPRVEVVRAADFVCSSLEPAIGVEISYIEGIRGSNIFILSQDDIKKIVDILLGGDGTNTEAEFGEMHFSAVGEVMNQMMGSSSTALADFFGTPINISTPKTYALEKDYNINGNAFSPDGMLVSVTFDFSVGDVIKSEMISTLTMDCEGDDQVGHESDGYAGSRTIGSRADCPPASSSRTLARIRAAASAGVPSRGILSAKHPTAAPRVSAPARRVQPRRERRARRLPKL